MEKVSVLVPVYNSQDYIEQCVRSIMEQTYTNLEIVLVNDGSTDGTAAILERLADEDDRIRAIHKQNAGIGATRNRLLNLATGDYYMFVDNDDWLEPNCVEDLYKALQEAHADIAAGNFARFINDSGTFLFHNKEDKELERIHTPASWFAYQYNTENGASQCFTVPWCKLYKKAVFKDVFYPEDTHIEDDYTTWKTYLNAESIVFINKVLYIHRKSGESVSDTANVADVYPVASVEERIATLSSLGMDISEELSAYRWRLGKHAEAALARGDMLEYFRNKQKLNWLEK